jgi:hypothetical protein
MLFDLITVQESKELAIKNRLGEEKMKNLRNLLTGFVLGAILLLGVGKTNAGILMTDLKGDSPQLCTETENKANDGVIVTGLTGVIVTGFGVIVTGLTGVIVTGAVEDKADCGILMTD